MVCVKTNQYNPDNPDTCSILIMHGQCKDPVWVHLVDPDTGLILDSKTAHGNEGWIIFEPLNEFDRLTPGAGQFILQIQHHQDVHQFQLKVA